LARTVDFFLQNNYSKSAFEGGRYENSHARYSIGCAFELRSDVAPPNRNVGLAASIIHEPSPIENSGTSNFLVLAWQLWICPGGIVLRIPVPLFHEFRNPLQSRRLILFGRGPLLSVPRPNAVSDKSPRWVTRMRLQPTSPSRSLWPGSNVSSLPGFFFL